MSLEPHQTDFLRFSAARIADAVVSRLPVAQAMSAASNLQRRYVREREAMEYMGVKVATLRA